MKKITLSNEYVIEFIKVNCNALKITPDEFIIKLINNMRILSSLPRKDQNDRDNPSGMRHNGAPK